MKTKASICYQIMADGVRENTRIDEKKASKHEVTQHW